MKRDVSGPIILRNPFMRGEAAHERGTPWFAGPNVYR